MPNVPVNDLSLCYLSPFYLVTSLFLRQSHLSAVTLTGIIVTQEITCQRNYFSKWQIILKLYVMLV